MYKPSPNGWFMALFYPHYMVSQALARHWRNSWHSYIIRTAYCLLHLITYWLNLADGFKHVSYIGDLHPCLQWFLPITPSAHGTALRNFSEFVQFSSRLTWNLQQASTEKCILNDEGLMLLCGAKAWLRVANRAIGKMGQGTEILHTGANIRWPRLNQFEMAPGVGSYSTFYA